MYRQNNAERRIFVRADKGLAYGRVMEVMGTINQGGFTKVALLAEQAATAAPPAGTPAVRPGGSGGAGAPRPTAQRRPAG